MANKISQYLGILGLVGTMLSGCETNNDWPSKQETIDSKKEERLEQLSKSPYENINEPGLERIYFDNEDKEVRRADYNTHNRGTPAKVKNVDTYDIQGIDVFNDTVNISGASDIGYGEKYNHANVTPPHEVNYIGFEGDRYNKPQETNFEGLSNLNGDKTYVKKYMVSHSGPDTVKISFEDAPKQGQSFSVVEDGTRGYAFNHNGISSDYTKISGEKLYFGASPDITNKFPDQIRFCSYDSTTRDFKTEVKYELKLKD